MEYMKHPGGQSLLRMARGHTRPDLLFLAYHLGRDPGAVRAASARRGLCVSDIDSELYRALSEAARRASLPKEQLLFRGYCGLVGLGLPFALIAFVLTLHPLSGLMLTFFVVSYAFTVFHTRHHFGGRP
ncbi:MAG: hypothetical protein AAFZ18_39805, partial [Myxococcota bacterium]